MTALYFVLSLIGTAGAALLFCWSTWILFFQTQTRHWPKWSTGKSGIPISRLSIVFGTFFSGALVFLFLPSSDPRVRLTGIVVALLAAVGGTISFARDVFEKGPNP